MNRPVRTRMPGGVGGASEQSGSLSRSLFVGITLIGDRVFAVVEQFLVELNRLLGVSK